MKTLAQKTDASVEKGVVGLRLHGQQFNRVIFTLFRVIRRQTRFTIRQ